VFIGFHGERTCGLFTVDIGCIIGVSDDEGSSSFSVFMLYFLTSSMNKTGIGTTVDEGVFLDAALPLV